MSGVAVLVVAAGKGERAGGAVPKQYAPLLGKPILRWTVEAFARHPRVTSVQVAIGPGQEQLYAAAIEGLDLLPPVIGFPKVRIDHPVLTRLSVLLHHPAHPLQAAMILNPPRSSNDWHRRSLYTLETILHLP
jgi:CTP:molybdopterin cytidylyltransferase MocA